MLVNVDLQLELALGAAGHCGHGTARNDRPDQDRSIHVFSFTTKALSIHKVHAAAIDPCQIRCGSEISYLVMD